MNVPLIRNNFNRIYRYMLGYTDFLNCFTLNGVQKNEC